MPSTRLLRIALLANAAFSTSCALVMIFTPAWVGHLLGIQMSLALQTIGLGLVIFAADLIYQATGSRMVAWRALCASIADSLWVVAAAVGVALFPGRLSNSGLLTVGSIAALVLLFGLWQLWGISHGSADAHKSGI